MSGILGSPDISRLQGINQDGYADIIIGAPGANVNQGAAYVIYGAERSSLSHIDLSSTPLDHSTTGFKITGGASQDLFGATTHTAGDINKDGYDDIIIGAYGENGKGAVYVIYGGPKSSLPNINIGSTTLNPATNGFTIKGASSGDTLGRWASTAGDVNNDGYDDIIFGAHTACGSNGAVYLVYGGPKSSSFNTDLTALVPGSTGFTIKGNAPGDLLGSSVGTAGDINNDGYDDIIIGAYSKNSAQGAVYVIYGGEKSSLLDIDLSLTSLDPATTGFTLVGGLVGDAFGFPASTAGDLNNDGYDDIIIGANGWDSLRGIAYVIYGGPKSRLSDMNFASTTLDPATTGFTIEGDDNGDQFGACVATAGDINNDGFDDIIIGAPIASSSLGKVYVIHTGCPTTYCTSCVSRICHVCDLGYGLETNSLCETCPNNCYQCQYSSTCEECNSAYFLYQSWCLPACPTRTFSSNDKCQDCPLFCSSCASLKSCQTCDQGYTLSDSLCVAPPSYPKTEAKATQTVASAVRGIGSSVTIGSAMSPMTALVSKIVQSTRYLNLSVTEELAEIYKTWSTELISWEVPNVITKFDHFKTSPDLFSRYDLDSSFLANFWATLMTLLLSLAIFVVFYAIQKLFENARYDNWLSSLVLKFVAGSFNFALVQAYGCFCDILFYLVLDFKTNPFNTFFCWASFFSAVGFLALGCFLVFFNIWKVRQYQGIKRNTTDIEAFNQQNKKWELFYSDFNDDDLWTQSTLAILVVRSSLSNILTTTLYEYPLMQTAFFIIMDGAIMLFLYFKSPFVTLRGKLAQYYFEAVTLLVHLCTFMLAMQDTFPSSSETLREILSTGIIYMNTALISGSLSFMSIEIYKTISRKRKENQRKQSEKTLAPTSSEDTLEAQSILSHTQTTPNIPHPEFDAQDRLGLGPNKQIIPIKNSHLSPEKNDFFSGSNLQNSNHLNDSLHLDDSILSQQRGHRILPIARNRSRPRPRPRKIKHLKTTLMTQNYTRNGKKSGKTIPNE